MIITLTKKELEIMQILWSSEKAMSATDIIQCKPVLKMSTVQAVLRSLLKRSYINITDIVRHTTVYARTYSPCITEKEYMLAKFNASTLDSETFITALVKQEYNYDVLQQLESLIKQQKEKLIKEKK